MSFLEDLLNKAKSKINDWRVAGHNSQFAQNANNYLNTPTTQAEHPWLSGANSLFKGASSGVVGGTNVDKFVADKAGFDEINNYQPQSALDKLLYNTGYVGGMIASPLTNNGGLLNMGKNALWGGTFGAGTSGIGNMISGNGITLKNTLEGAKQGAKYSWLYPYTNKATDQALIAAANKFPSVAKYVAPLTENALSQASKVATTSIANNGFRSALPKVASNIVKGSVREGLETPLESGAFATMDTLNGQGDVATNFKDRIAGDFITNLLMGGARSGVKDVWGGYKGSQIPKSEEQPVETITQPRPEVATGQNGVAGPVMKPVTDAEIQKQKTQSGMTAISDILKNRKIQVDETPASKTAELDYKKEALQRQTGFKPEFIEQKIKEGYSPEKIYSAYNYAKESPTPVKNMEGYVTKALRTNNFSTPEVKPPKVEDTANTESLMATAPEKAPVTVTQPKVEQPAYKPNPDDKRTFKQRFQEAKTEQDVQNVLAEGSAKLDQLEALYKSRGTDIEKVITELESGVVSDNTKALTEALNIGKGRAESDLGKAIKERKNYFTHLSPEKIQEINSRPSTPDTAGSVLSDPFFAKQRTGKLKEYSKSRDAIMAYWKESLKNATLTPEQKADIDIANKAVEVYKDEPAEVVEGVKATKPKKFSLTAMIEEKRASGEYKTPETRKKYSNIKSDNYLMRSTDQLAGEKNTDKEFYNDFLWNFKKAQVETAKYTMSLKDSTIEDLRMMVGTKNTDLTRDDLLSILHGRNYKENQTKAINAFLTNVKNAEFTDGRLKKVVDQIFDDYVGLDIKNEGKVDKVLSTIRSVIARGALALNVLPAFNNIKEIARATSLTDPDTYTKAFNESRKRSLTEEYGYDSAKSSEAGRRLDKGRNIVRKFLSKVDKGMMAMFDESEKAKDNFMLAAFEEQAKKKGLEGEDFTKFVVSKFDEYAIKFGKGQDIGLFKNKYIKTIFQFMQYSLKDSVIAYDKAVGAAGGDLGDRKYLVKYVASKLAEAVLNKAVLGTAFVGGGTNTFIDMYTNLIEKDETGQKRWIDRLPMSPAVKLLYSMGESTIKGDFTTPDVTDDYDKNYRLAGIKRTANLAVPAGNQILNKTVPYWQARNKGYYETMSGNVAGPVGTGAVDTVRGTLFGKSYDSKRKEYIENLDSSPSLTKNESAVYKQLPADQREKFYLNSQAKEKQKADTEAMKSGKPIKKEGGFLDGLFGKKEDKTSLVLPDKYSTPQDKKDFKSDYDTRVNLGYQPTDEEVKARFFDGDKNAKSKDLKTKEEAYKSIKSVLDNEDLPQEYKDQVIKASGASKEDVDYYMSAIETDEVRLQALLPYMNNKDHAKTVDMLMKSRRSVADKPLLTDGMIDYLYERDHISEDEKEMLKAIKFDEINNEFYVKKAFAKKGEGGKLSLSKAKSLFKYDFKLPQYKSINSILSTNSTNTSNNRLVEEILSTGSNPRLSGKKLWFKPY